MEIVVLIFTGIAGVILTFITGNLLQQGAVRASAGLSLLIALFFYFFPNLLSEYLTHHIPFVFFGASFVGMVSKNLVSTYWALGISGIIFSLIYINTGPYFEGFGGALGTTASISVIVILGIIILQKKFFPKREIEDNKSITSGNFPTGRKD